MKPINVWDLFGEKGKAGEDCVAKIQELADRPVRSGGVAGGNTAAHGTPSDEQVAEIANQYIDQAGLLPKVRAAVVAALQEKKWSAKAGAVVALLFGLMLLLAPHAAQAEESPSQYPFIAKQRLTLGARAEYAVWGDRANEAPSQLSHHKEAGVGIAASYALVPNLALTYRTIYYVDNQIFGHAVGLNFLIYSGRR